MIENNLQIFDRFYEPDHIAVVISDISQKFSFYYADFASKHLYTKTLTHFKKEQYLYLDLFDIDNLEEYEYDPAAFKGVLGSNCPLIRRCLNSRDKAMDRYQFAFRNEKGHNLLKVCKNITNFANTFATNYNRLNYQNAQSPEELGISELDSDTYKLDSDTIQVIGRGIRSHILYNLYPHIFPNRSQDSIWALYFLSECNDYGYHDGSEFLMIKPDGSGTQQNYWYPYDLFTYYGNHIFQYLEKEAHSLGYPFDRDYLYVYLDAFLSFVADTHREDINILRPEHEQREYY